MSESIDTDVFNNTLGIIQNAKQSFDESKKGMDQKIKNRRRQAEYDLSYMDWANHSIRVMASYTIMLVATLLILVLIYFYGNEIKEQTKKMMGGSTSTTIPSA